MRSIYIPLMAVSLLAACASQSTASATPAKAEPAPTAKTAEAPKAPHCYSAESGKFVNSGEKAVIAGVPVVCKASADGKGASWVGDKKLPPNDEPAA